MENKIELITKIVEIAAGVIAGYVAYRLSAPIFDFAGLFSVIIGLLSALVVAHLIESYRHSQDIRKMNHHLADLLQTIAERYQDAADIARVLQYGVTTFPRDQFIDAMLPLFWKVENELLATSYVSPDEGWSRSYGELIHEIQRTKIKVNKANIRRVFIVDSEDEFSRLRDVMTKQKQAGIKVKYIFRDAIEKTSMLKSHAERLESLDFDVVDAQCVWLSVLDKNRNIKYGRVVFGKEACDRYCRFHNVVFEEAKEI
ncbi:MAG: hypothetical protein JSW02_09835 [candidate division WOR-3 bacterium]|nr:MAG: hypothetical protein JSW02_09835 [candidate division WOR-3 bacterium]